MNASPYPYECAVLAGAGATAGRGSRRGGSGLEANDLVLDDRCEGVAFAVLEYEASRSAIALGLVGACASKPTSARCLPGERSPRGRYRSSRRGGAPRGDRVSRTCRGGLQSHLASHSTRTSRRVVGRSRASVPLQGSERSEPARKRGEAAEGRGAWCAPVPF